MGCNQSTVSNPTSLEVSSGKNRKNVAPPASKKPPNRHQQPPIAKAQVRNICQQKIAFKTNQGKLLFEQGKSCYERKQYSKAINLFQKCLNMDENRSEIEFKIGVCFFNEQKYKQSQQWLEKCLKLNDKNQQALQLLAQSYYQQQKYDDSISTYQRCIQINNKCQNLYNDMGFCYYYKENYDQSIKCYQQCLKINPSNTTAYFRLAKALYYKQDYNQAIKNYQQFLNLSPNDHNVLSQIGICFYYKQQYKTAIDYYNKCLKINANNKNAYYRKGQANYYLQEYVQAIKSYQQYFELDPKSDKTVCQIGFCYYQLQQYDKALQFLNQSINLNPKNQLAHFRIGKTYYYQQKYVEAISIYKKCIQMNPKNDNYFTQIGLCYYQLESYNQAINQYKKALSINSKNPQTYHRIGLAYYYKQSYEQAIKFHKQCLKIEPKHFLAHFGIANCHYYNQNYDAAIQWWLKCMSIDPKYIYTYHMLGRAYFYNQDGEQANKYFKKNIQLDPNSVINYIYYGKSLMLVQNFGQSYKAFTKAKQLFQKQKSQNKPNLFHVKQINQFIRDAAEWQQKKKIGYISPQDKQQILRMKKSFEKKFNSLFAVSLDANKKRPANPVIIQIAKLIKIDQFKLSTQTDNSIFKITDLVKAQFFNDNGAFQILAYIFEQYVWFQLCNEDKKYVQIEEALASIIKVLSDKNPPTVKRTQNLENTNIIFPEYKQKKLNLFKQIQYFSSYDILVIEIEKANDRAKLDLPSFRQLVYKIQKQCEGFHAKVGMKLPTKSSQSSSEQYQQKLFRVLIRIFEKMFKQLQSKKGQLFESIQKKISNQILPIPTIILIIMNIWMASINSILSERQQQKIPTECFISDLVRGKCMFKNVEAIKKAAEFVIKECNNKGYQIMELDNRMSKVTQDIVFKIKIQQVVSEFQLALEFDSTLFEFGHSFYEIQRCPLGCIFGSSLFLTKEVSESFPQQIFINIQSFKNKQEQNSQGIEALNYVFNTFKNSSQKRQKKGQNQVKGKK